MSKPSKSSEKLKLLTNYRQELFTKLLDRKISSEEFANSCFQYILQNKIKPVAKAHDAESIFLNYYYWVSQIERKVAIERRLIEWGAGSVDRLIELVEVYSKRRDQMVRRLLWELEIPVTKAYVVIGDLVELLLPDGQVLFYTKESLDKVKFKVEHFGNSKMPYYLPILDIRQNPHY